MLNNTLQIALAQLNMTTGDIAGNTAAIIAAIKEARDRLDAQSVIFPELSITGYPPEDLLLRPGLYYYIEKALQQILTEAHGIDVVLGYPRIQGHRIYNACSVLRAGAVLCTYDKQELPNYAVFDEKRYFLSGHGDCVYDFCGIKVGLSICEDIWASGPTQTAAKKDARLLFNINASPFHINKLKEREALLKKRAKENDIDIIYVNLVGGQDELVFDGSSMAVSRAGALCYRAPQFKKGLYLVEWDRQKGTFNTVQQYVAPAPAEIAGIYQALVLGVRDYAYKNSFKGAVLGLSGGIDSALTLTIAVDALGSENVTVLIMPSRYTAGISIEDAQRQADHLKVRSQIISIEKPVQAFTEILQPILAAAPADSTEENIQARCRGILLMALSNKTDALLLTTGNKSEMAVGYTTLYGDMAGGFAPLKDVSKTLVYRLARWLPVARSGIPERVIERPPSAELKPDQKDEDTLPPYSILDQILADYLEQDAAPEQIIEKIGRPELVRAVIDKVDRNEYKRRQAAPGIKITGRAFGRDRRYPITNAYRE